jgi:MarR family 2-MHQ and catechol resistance regulon transcriptional repressor
MGTHYRGSAREVRALDALIKLVRAAGSVGTRIDRRLAEHGLTETQFGILEVLLHLGPKCQADLGRKLLRSGGNITLVVDNLEKRRLVRRVRSEEDRRFVTVSLTPEGRKLIASIFPAHVEAMTRIFGVLDKDEQEELARLCKKLGLALAQAGEMAG